MLIKICEVRQNIITIEDNWEGYQSLDMRFFGLVGHLKRQESILFGSLQSIISIQKQILLPTLEPQGGVDPSKLTSGKDHKCTSI